MLLLLLACNKGFDREPVAEVALTAEALPGREWRRINVDQVDASLQHATVGHGWNEGDTNLFEGLAGTLGKPDYIAATDEDLTAGLLFQKFLDDAGKQSCGNFVWDELGKPDGERVWLVGLTSSDTAGPLVDEAVARGLLRFHGKRVSGKALEPWMNAFSSAVDETEDAPGAWTMICVGYVTHPDFYAH